MTHYDADEILGRMRADRESDWPTRLIRAMGRQPVTLLSPGERRALQGSSYGLTHQMIADSYGISTETIKRQLLKAREKLKAKNVTHAVAIAIRQGIF